MFTKMNIKKDSIISIAFVIFYFFRQSIYYINPDKGYFLVGNLDIFYLLGILYLFIYNKKIMKKELLLIGILILYGLIQIAFLNNIDSLRLIINIGKIIVCFFVMKYAVKNFEKINVELVIKLFSVLCIIFLMLSFIFRNSNILWRHNDTINVYDLNRIQFLYTEPGELGFHCSIMLIIAFSYLKQQKNKIKYVILYIVPVLLALYFTKSLGGIAVGILGIIAVYASELIFNFNIKKMIIALALIIIGLTSFKVLNLENSTLFLRLRETQKNHDSSTRYRINIPFKVTPKILEDTNGIGIGFGNLELEQNVSKYNNYGLGRQGIINSFMNFIAEGGYIGIIISVYLIYKIFKSAITSKSPLKIGLAVFIVAYQFMGTYFTNPLCWIIYGVILYKRDDSKENDNKENDVTEKMLEE